MNSLEAQSLDHFILNISNHSIQTLEYLLIGKSQDGETNSSKQLISFLIFCQVSRLEMLNAIYFNHKADSRRIEINNELQERFLTIELYAVNLFPTNSMP